MNRTVQFWRSWIASQLEHNLDHMVECSIKNFHFPGLNYVCFQFTPYQTIRLYIVRPEDHLRTDQVSIHNHLYDSQLLCLHGWLRNTVYRVDYEHPGFNHYHLTSALHPENADRTIKLEHFSNHDLEVSKVSFLYPGDFHFQSSSEIHNVTNDPDTLTAWMVFEFPTVKEHSTLFSQENLGDTIPTPNAYLRYERDELRDIVLELLEAM